MEKDAEIKIKVIFAKSRLTSDNLLYCETETGTFPFFIRYLLHAVMKPKKMNLIVFDVKIS